MLTLAGLWLIYAFSPSLSVAQTPQTYLASDTASMAQTSLIVSQRAEDPEVRATNQTMDEAIDSYCVAPTQPYGSPPRAPYCSASQCSSWEIDNFKAEVEDYIDDMNQYLADAQNYAACGVEEAIGQWNRFAAGY